MNSHKQLTRKILSRGSAAGVAAFFLMAGVALAQAPQSPPAPAGGMDHGAMGHDMKGMDMKGMDMSMPLMPGMLSPQQMKDLAAAKGPIFDHLFLTGMIQHHTGALTMVADLYNTPGAGEDNVLFDFATDIDNTQRAEIRIMQALLDKENKLDQEKK